MNYSQSLHFFGNLFLYLAVLFAADFVSMLVWNHKPAEDKYAAAAVLALAETIFWWWNKQAAPASEAAEKPES